MGTNDPYWPVDAVKNYIDSIPGDNHICYTPNAAHDLGDKKTAFAGLSALVGSAVTKKNLPACNYSISQNNGTVTVRIKPSADILLGVTLWSADSKNQDFRDDKWTVKDIPLTDKQEFTVDVNVPDSGFRAFYVDLKYKAPYGDDFTQSTRMFVTNNQKLLLKDK
jgi:PhoPQ-activated pathogenicity-related protein